MAEFGYFLASEEYGPKRLVEVGGLAEAAGFDRVWISDHYHPWTDAQGQSPFVWAVIGGLAASTGLRVTTAVTCPTIRIHPAIIAQAAATCSLLLDGRFQLGVGSGEALNEHILATRWPRAAERLAMLAEAVEVMRKLWTGKLVSHDGEYYRVENARIYSCPDAPPPVIVSAFGPDAVELAARVGDGWCATMPDADLVGRYEAAGGKGPKQAGMKVCWGEDEQAARRLAHELWPTVGLPGQLAQELALPEYFEQATQLVTEDMVAEVLPYGPDPERHVAAIREFIDAGYDEVYVQQIGPDQEGFLDFWKRELAPRLPVRSR
jgi:G6PDH family F420-dependent oxidoreductase